MIGQDVLGRVAHNIDCLSFHNDDNVDDDDNDDDDDDNVDDGDNDDDDDDLVPWLSTRRLQEKRLLRSKPKPSLGNKI